ncbi:MAG: aerobic carbon-monoxide dehydrogenase medium subunit [Candidatus Eremiobacteraeota bacterium]|jgi:carbon-monoxide dehydrogenase medium subunit|nr:aerobic carbon-monoxide dehydrogenase medium subunit [Candidatus Eremiobacteraeota bacterium]
MIPAAFDYVRATSVEDAIRLLEEHGEDAKLLAGGHSLIPMMKLRLAAPSVLIDIAGIPQLDGIRVSGNRVTIGALTKHAALAASDDLRKNAGALYDAANDLGDPQVRNRGTIGGASAHGDPSADYPAVLQALEATFTLTGKGGTRELRAADFFRGMFDTALDAHEVLTQIAFDAAPSSAYVKFHHPASHYAVVGVAAALNLTGGMIDSARVAITGIGDSAFRASGVESALQGVNVSDEEAVRAACAGAARGVTARSDTFASATYRAAMADVFAARAVAKAASAR